MSISRTVAPGLWSLAVLVSPLGATAPAVQQDAPPPVVLAGGTVIDPALEGPIENATVVVVDGEIASVGSGAVEIPDGARVIDVGGHFVLPGLIDAHVHIEDFDGARRALSSGVTTARSMGAGFSDVGLRILSGTGVIDAPELLAAGYHVRPRPADGFFVDEPGTADLLASGVHGAEALRRMARAMISRGVDVIKVNATARAGLPDTDPREPYYSEAELRALVEEANGAGVPVAAHAHGDEGGRAAVLAGVRSIEHGTYLSDETLGLMVERGTYLVPTIAVVADLTEPGGDYDNPVLRIRGRHMLPRVRRMAASAHRLGVRIAAATDTGYGSESVLRLSQELIELVQIGMTPLEAIRAATTVAAELLGVEDHAGRVAPGYDADLIVLEGDPLEDIGAFQEALLVMNDGRIVVERLEW